LRRTTTPRIAFGESSKSNLPGVDPSEESLGLIRRARCEKQDIGRTSGSAVPESEAPQPVDHDGLAALVLQMPQLLERRCVERVDSAVAEIPNEQIAFESTEVCG